ncbi:hypothetical protein AKJ09_00349 [Labilithrix luteola]|uniref:Uncharacterized protein n=1 Tax=Labilithrix luteola TaxID=1391654 RepID=A0A0K1PJI2_9BACT|nr:hypothetical protein AKJ09_00349 [Labilithrix luteola]
MHHVAGGSDALLFEAGVHDHGGYTGAARARSSASFFDPNRRPRVVATPVVASGARGVAWSRGRVVNRYSVR